MNTNNKIYTLDFSNAKNSYEIHEIIKNAFNFPSHYGFNWDAFWDCASDMVSDEGMSIEIIGLDKIYSKNQRDIDIFIEALKDLKHIYSNKYATVIKISIKHGQSFTELT